MRTSLLVLFNLSKSHFATLFSMYSAIWFISLVFLMMRSWKRDCHAKGMLFWREWQVIARLNPPITTDNAPRLCEKLFWISPKSFSRLDVSVFVCALGDFLVLSASVLRQIARYLPHHTSGSASKTHPKSSHDKFKTVSDISRILLSTVSVFQRACCDGRGCRDDVHIVSTVFLTISIPFRIQFIYSMRIHKGNDKS